MAHLVVRHPFGCAFFGCSGVGPKTLWVCLGIQGPGIALEPFLKDFWVWGQKPVGSYVLCRSGDLSGSPNSLSQPPEKWRDAPPARPCERASRRMNAHARHLGGPWQWAGGSSSRSAAHPRGKNQVVGHSRSRLGCCSVLLLFMLSEDLPGNK